MIKVSIVGADSPQAGELLRILVNHPEVDIISLYSPGMAGREVSCCHHGFIGERTLSFTDKIDPVKLDAVFIANDSEMGRQIVERREEWENLRVINMAPSRFDHWENSDMEYGLSEINRKPLVRGAKAAIIPSAPAAVALISLYPLAANLLLSSDIDIEIISPPFLKLPPKQKVEEEICRQIKKYQTGFEGKISIRYSKGVSERGIRAKVSMKCPLSVMEVNKFFESIYDDHNFTFMTMEPISDKEVTGTQKCVVSFCKPGAGLIEIETVADGFLRGGAGDAVHMLNLLFALHEKVGLHLKSSVFGDSESLSSKQTSWFA
ncbi:MAG: hypothetical protein HDR88_08650 [Bacteroides sp.]|nr:hypothetical protein [Bacteroides sp.]